MELEERKKRILSTIVESYIVTAEPVGSRALSKQYPLSSATIRNEMSDLEELGLLEQPHTSAGRVPSDLGYRMYVDHLMDKYALTNEERQILRRILDIKVAQVDTILQEISRIYSKLTNYTVAALAPDAEKVVIKHLQLMPVDANVVLLAVVTSKNAVRTEQIRLVHEITNETISELNAVLGNYLCGLDAAGIRRIGFEGPYADTLRQIADFALKSIDNAEYSDVVLGGTANLLDFPEYSNVRKARELIDFLQDKSNIRQALLQSDGEGVVIGKENVAYELKECSVVVSRYRGSGVIGIIGPKRMNYSRAVSILEYLSEQLGGV